MDHVYSFSAVHANPTPAPQLSTGGDLQKKKQPLTRKEMLMKWKAEKELKKKLEKEKNTKKTFKVTHVSNDVVAFSKPFSTLPKRDQVILLLPSMH
jgi:hypothetical protein